MARSLSNPFRNRYGQTMRKDFFSGRLTPGIVKATEYDEPLFDDEDEYEDDDFFYDPTIIYMGRLTPDEVQPSSLK